MEPPALIIPHSTCAAVADGRPVIMVSPIAADSAAFSWVMVMIAGVGRPRALCLTGTSWKKASSVPEVNQRRSMPLSFIDAIIASAACSAGIEYVGSIADRILSWLAVADRFASLAPARSQGVEKEKGCRPRWQRGCRHRWATHGWKGGPATIGLPTVGKGVRHDWAGYTW